MFGQWYPSPRQNRLCWVSRDGKSPTPLERGSAAACRQSLEPSYILHEIAFPPVFDLPNRVRTSFTSVRIEADLIVAAHMKPLR
jgi:hypothetical protein